MTPRFSKRTASFIGAVILFLLSRVTIAADPHPTIAAPPRPNIVIILADDQGWGDLSVNGNTNLSTPAIDGLAKSGAILDRFFVCPVCSPTRAEFLTGRYHPRGGVHGVSTGGERLNLDERTIADIFKAAGYATAAFGKWHNGTQYPYHPNARGFDEYYGFTSGHWGNYFDPPLDHNGQWVTGHGFITDDLTDHAMTWIEQHRDVPFFCYVPFNTPHSPMQVPDRYWNKFAGAEIKLRATRPQAEDVPFTRAALAMCENIDWNVSRILGKLDELKLADNTIVIYFSDNGPNGWRWNGGMKGIKGSTDEGGVRVPFMIRWPGHIPPGGHVPQIAGAIDLLPTLADLAGLNTAGLQQAQSNRGKPLDGVSLKPLLLGTAAEWPDRMIFSHWAGRVSVRTQRYRLDNDSHLFDMQADPGQTRDVAADNKAMAGQLSAAVVQWKKEMLPGLEDDRRPFTVGFPQFPVTPLPARDGVPHGNVRRSSGAPNCSYFRNWTSTQDSMTWDIEIATAGQYEAVVCYTCPAADVGSTIELSLNGRRVQATVTEAHDPPLMGAEHDRVPRKGESYVKDFKPLRLGLFDLPAGKGLLTLRALHVPGKQVMDVRVVLLTLKAGSPPSAPTTQEANASLRDIADIRIRDPFILTDGPNKRYVMVAKIHRKEAMGWECYTSNDLRHWQAPVTVFTPPPGFWADQDFWAPEIHAYLGKYYLLGTVSSEHAKRGTQIFVADQPLGPYRPHSDGAVTPHDWMALDGTLHVENGHPWMVFCHEWLQTGDGTMNAIPLATDLSRPTGEPIQLFRASEAPWCRPIKPGKYVTDGPWVYRMGNGRLLLLWSSFSNKGYAVGIARSESGKIEGPWKHDARPLFEGGGHCMAFRSLEGNPMLLLHAPNKQPDERARFFDIHEDSDDLRIEPVDWQRTK